MVKVRGNRRDRYRSRRGAALAVLLIGWASVYLVVAPAGRAAGATFTVNSTADLVDSISGDGICQASNGLCTLRAAVQEANDAATDVAIVIPPGTYTIAIPPDPGDGETSGDFNVTNASGVAFIGDVANPASTVINGGGLDRVLRNDPAAPLTVEGLTITGGVAPAGARGGGILATGDLTVQHTVVTGNHADTSEGGGIAVTGGTASISDTTITGNQAQNGGGLIDFNAGPVTVTNTIVSNNLASGPPGSGLGGGIEFLGTNPFSATGVTMSNNTASNAGGGIAAFNGGPVTISASAITGNQATAVGGGVETDSGAVLNIDTTTISGNSASYAGGLDLFAGTTTLKRSLISNNVADARPFGGVGLPGEGGGVLVEQGNAKTFVDVTFSGNSAASAGGGLRVISGAAAPVALTQVTMSGDTAAGVSSELENDDGVQSSINVADSIVNGKCPGVSGAVTSANHNLELGSSCGFVAANDQQNVDPQLGSLGDHGGPTQTMPLAAASPAVNAGSCPAFGLTVDQRGVARPQGAACDAGAFERAPATTVTLGNTPASSVFGQPVVITVQVAPTATNTALPTGTITFLDAATTIGTASLAAGTAQLTISTLAPGLHSLSASYGGDFDFDPATTAAPSGQTVDLASTSTSLSDLSGPTVTGQTVTISATVVAVAPGSGTPTGLVDFSESGNPIGSASVSGGTATLTTLPLVAGTYHFAAAYQGDCCFVGSASAVVDVVVAKAATGTALAAAPEPSDPGAAVTLTAQVAPVGPGAGSPTGTVTFRDGGTLIGSATVDAATGTAAVTIPGGSLLIGTHTLTATYGGDAGFDASTSPPTDHVVGVPAAPRLTAIQGPNPGEVTLTWTLPPAGTGVTGVRVLRGPDAAGLVPLADVAAPTADFVDASLPPGTRVVYALSALSAGAVGAPGAAVPVVVPGVVAARADQALSLGAVPVTVDVLANDVGVGLAPATVTIVTPPSTGTAQVGADQRITVDPDDAAFGPVTVSYRIDSPAALPSALPIIGTLTVDVTPVSVHASSDGGPVAIDIASADPNVAAAGSGVRIDLIGPAQHGTADVTGTRIRYQPAAGFAGVDTVMYRAVLAPLSVTQFTAAAVNGHVSTGRIDIVTTRVLAEVLTRPPASPAAPAPKSPAAPAAPVAGPPSAPPAPPPGTPATPRPATPSTRDDLAAGPPGSLVRVDGVAPPNVRCSNVAVFFGHDRLGTANVHGGRFHLEAAVPGNASTGLHELSFTCHGDSAHFPLAPFRVTHASVHRTAFVTSVHLPRSIPLDAKNLAESALLAAVLLALVAFPAELFNSTLDANYDEVRAWFGMKRPIRGRIGGGWSTAAIFFAVAGAIYGLLDPGFGFNLSSLAEYGGLVASLLIVTAAFGLPAVLVAHKRSGRWGTVQVLPGTVVLAAVCVALSRLLHFQPGYLYGLVAGMSLAGELSEDEEARYSAVACLVVLVASMVAWLAWLPVQHRTAQPHPAFLLLMLEAALAATFVSGLESVVVGLLPLRFLEGARIMRWRRSVWAGLFALGLFAFVHILLRPGAGYVGHSSAASAVTVVAIFAAFSLGSMLFWAYFRFRRVQPARVTR